MAPHWIYSTVSVTFLYCPKLNIVLRCNFKSVSQENNHFPWPADYTLANANQYAVDLVVTRTPCLLMLTWLWGLQASFLQKLLSSHLSPACTGIFPSHMQDFTFSFEILRSCFSSLPRCPWAAALPSIILTALPNLLLNMNLLCEHSVLFWGH